MSESNEIPIGVRGGADALIAELEALAEPLNRAIATARRLREIAQPADEDARIGAGLFKAARTARGFASLRGAIANFDRMLAKLDSSMKGTAARVPWFRRGPLGG
jgi:hypothetical protein